MRGRPLRKKSMPGTNCTETSKYGEFLGIIEGCRNLGVSKVKTPDFEVEFFLEKSVEVGDFEDVGIPKKPTSIDKDLMEEVRLSQLMIDDPFGFEREVLQAEQRRVVDEAVQN